MRKQLEELIAALNLQIRRASVAQRARSKMCVQHIQLTFSKHYEREFGAAVREKQKIELLTEQRNNIQKILDSAEV